MSALDHLPYGVFSTADREPRIAVLVDDRVLDLADAAESGLLDADPALFTAPSLNAFMAAGRPVWRATREALRDLLQDEVEALVPLAEARLHLPFEVADYVDFYSSRDARGEPRPALPPRLRPADCRTGCTCRSDTTAAPARSSSAARRSAGRRDR